MTDNPGFQLVLEWRQEPPAGGLTSKRMGTYHGETTIQKASTDS
jgi:hypothetical protein